MPTKNSTVETKPKSPRKDTKNSIDKNSRRKSSGKDNGKWGKARKSIVQAKTAAMGAVGGILDRRKSMANEMIEDPT